jgi:hypothetical protein
MKGPASPWSYATPGGAMKLKFCQGVFLVKRNPERLGELRPDRDRPKGTAGVVRNLDQRWIFFPDEGVKGILV